MEGCVFYSSNLNPFSKSPTHKFLYQLLFIELTGIKESNWRTRNVFSLVITKSENQIFVLNSWFRFEKIFHLQIQSFVVCRKHGNPNHSCAFEDSSNRKSVCFLKKNEPKENRKME